MCGTRWWCRTNQGREGERGEGRNSRSREQCCAFCITNITVETDQARTPEPRLEIKISLLSFLHRMLAYGVR